VTDDVEFITFIRESVRSVWAMELLLLFHRNPDRHWQPGELVHELRANAALVNDNLAIFQRNGLVVCAEEGWVFAPANEKLLELTGRLAQAFRERPVATMTLVTRADPLKSFSDAFKLRGEDT
jgi:hypothetical protein